jgi:PKD repeat protein
MKSSTLVFAALVAFTGFAGNQVRADSMASIAIAPATGKVTLTPRWSIGGNLSGFHFMAQDLSLTGGASNEFYSTKSTAIPSGGDITAFTFYVPGSGAATNHADIGSKLTPNSYSALTSADPDLGYGSVQLYFIHHKTDGDYFTHIVPSSGAASAVADLKPMSQPGGPATGGASGYFGLTFSAANLGDGANMFYYLRNDTVTNTTRFGAMSPALAGASTDKFNLGINGHNALAFTGTDVGFGINKMYFQRLDPVTGFTIIGTLDPVSGRASDIANLGSVYSTLTFVPGDVGFGVNNFYTTGAVNATWQSVSFAAIADRLISAGSFTVTPTASSTLAIALTVVPGSAGAASISGPVAGVFTITPTAPGLITLQATQAGQAGSFEYNMLRQSFTASGAATLAITSQPTAQSAVTGTTATFSVTASGTTAVTYQWRKAGANISGNASATTSTLSLTNVQAADAASYDVAVTNVSGTILSNAVTLTVTTAAPVITNSPLTAGGTVGTAFSFTIVASGSPTSYTATPLPAGLSIAGATGVISGSPTAVGTTSVLLGAINGTGTGNATLTITVAAAGVAPVITNSPLTAGGTVGTAFSFTIVASGSPTSYTATPLPAGLSIAGATGVISGSPTAVGTTSVLLGATNGTGTGNATLTITVAAAGVAPVITNSPLTAAGTNGTPFSFTITASGSPTSYSASPLPAGLSIVASTGVITGTPTATGTTSVVLGATNATGTGNATLTITVAAAGTAPIITNSPLTAAGTTGVAFSYTITASGSPTSYSATPLPAGLSIVALTGVITGTPTTVGTTSVLLGATNGSGTGNATLTITVAAAGTAPVITSSSVTAAATSGTPFSYTITASGVPTSYSASPLPAGLSIVTATGVITGTPTTVGTTVVLLGATNSSGTGNYALTITVSAAGTVPDITNNPLTAAGTVGAAFTFTITATGTPTSYAASGLPVGLVLNTVTGVITGTPALAGTAAVPLSATNAFGTDSATLSITIAAATVAPVITIPPTIPATVGAPITYVIVATGLPTSYTATGLPIGLTLNPLTGAITGTPTIPGTYTVVITATNAAGTSTVTFTIVVAPATVAPVITSPTTATGTVGTPLITYLIAATGLPTSYSASGLPAGLKVNPLTGAINGTPTVAGTFTIVLTATNSAGTSTATLTLTIAATPASRIVNFSARAVSGPGSQTLIVGFVVTGDGKNLMVRGIGPTLATFGVVNALADPMLSLFGSDGSVFASNDDWQTNLNGPSNGALIASVGAQVGAFALPNGSKDSALLATFNNGAHTTSMVRPNSTTGVALTEIYDIDTSSNSRLINVSARMNVTVGEGTLIAGLVIAGNTPKTVLVRGVGPTLSAFAVAGVLADPQISVYSGSTLVASNDNWETGASTAVQISGASAQVGAFALTAGSKDAALLLTLQPGAYTVVVSGVNATTGVALVEVYDVK